MTIFCHFRIHMNCIFYVMKITWVIFQKSYFGEWREIAVIVMCWVNVWFNCDKCSWNNIGYKFCSYFKSKRTFPHMTNHHAYYDEPTMGGAGWSVLIFDLPACISIVTNNHIPNTISRAGKDLHNRTNIKTLVLHIISKKLLALKLSSPPNVCYYWVHILTNKTEPQ